MTTHSGTTNRRTATLTGIKPTGELHLGNYAGAIRPLARLAADEHRDVFVFVADLHALNRCPEPPALLDRTRRLAAALLACGLDRSTVHIYRQSRVPAIARMAALLSNVTSKGLLNRAHAYKAAVAANIEAGRDPDHGINMGLYGYPVLMAADILALDADEVPVGSDQAQHLEIAVDLAQQYARVYHAGVLRSPQALITESVATLPGLDGRKMSKSYDNTIALMADPKVTADRIRRIITDSTPPDQPKDPNACTLIAILRAFADASTIHEVETRYRNGGIGYGEVKALLAEVIEQHVAPLRRRCERLLADPRTLQERLSNSE
ncbi:MAG: tryptophan--tRNA ligase, partial [Actinobacteria bacterium]|nr:tryptophan--tRNA ligase [Actinomycetota bacterium]MCA1698203.1 tryptophan--tRNA ligase [Actinomycetota bacterium]